MAGNPITLRRIGKFPVDCRLEHRELVDVYQSIIDQWFAGSGIIICSMADILEKKNLSNQLLYI